MKFCIQCPFIWLVLLILNQTIQPGNSASTKGKCENCTNLQELSLALAILGIVSLLFITLCLCRCLPKFTQIMFSSAEQLSAVHRAQHTQRLSQILKRQQQQLRAQQLARQSPNLAPRQQSGLEKGIFQDPFLGAGFGSVLLAPNRLVLPAANGDKQQVNGGLTLNKNKTPNDLNEMKSTPTGQKRPHPITSFAVAAQAASAATHMLHQQRASTLRKQLAKRSLEQQKQNKLKDPSFSSSFDQSQQQDQSTTRSPLTRFLKRSNVVRPVQLQHSLSLTSFAGVPKSKPIIAANKFHSPLANQLKLTRNEFKQPVKYAGIDKNTMTINQQPITLDLVYDPHDRTPPDQPAQFNYSNRDRLDDGGKLHDRLYSKSVQNIEQPIAWLDHDLISSEEINDEDELPLPAPLPIELLENRTKHDLSIDFPKSKSMPMLINQTEHALFTPYYIHEHNAHAADQLTGDQQLANYATFNHSTFHFRNANCNHNQAPTYGDETATCALTASMNHLVQHSSLDDKFSLYDPDQRRFLDTFGSDHRLHEVDQQQWPDAQLQQFLNAFNHYTQRTSVNRNQTRSLFDLY